MFKDMSRTTTYFSNRFFLFLYLFLHLSPCFPFRLDSVTQLTLTWGNTVARSNATNQSKWSATKLACAKYRRRARIAQPLSRNWALMAKRVLCCANQRPAACIKYVFIYNFLVSKYSVFFSLSSIPSPTGVRSRSMETCTKRLRVDIKCNIHFDKCRHSSRGHRHRIRCIDFASSIANELASTHNT